MTVLVHISSIILASLWPSVTFSTTSLANEAIIRRVPRARSLDSTWRCIKFVPLGNRTARYLYQRLADHIDGVLANDLFFDRLVYVNHLGDYDITNEKLNPTLADMTITLSGAIISPTAVITSWNPFRNVIRFRFKRYFTSVCVTYKRKYTSWVYNRPAYLMHEYEIACARPVVPYRDSDIPIDLWHGHMHDPKMHSPIHDLIVFRVSEPFDSLSELQYVQSTSFWANDNSNWAVVGPVLSKLAKEGEVLGRNVKFGMLGNSLSTNLLVKRNLYVREFDDEENVVTDCDEWIPREWGWFICLRNLDDIPRLASGAMLYYNETLFGVGAFALWKGNQSVLVFTDVRKYYDLIMETCTEEDQLVPHPKDRKKKTTTMAPP